MKNKPSDCLSELKTEFKTLIALDDKNQELFTRINSADGLTKAQMHLLTEAIFFAAFRSYEQFLHNVFLLYCCGSQSSGRKLVRSYLYPKTIKHAEKLIKSSMPFLDWSSPDILIDRAEAYLKDGYPLKIPISTKINELRAIKKVRNHIAHMSSESKVEYKKVLKIHFGTIPLKLIRPGEYLLLSSKEDPSTYYLRHYISLMEYIASYIT